MVEIYHINKKIALITRKDSAIPGISDLQITEYSHGRLPCSGECNRKLTAYDRIESYVGIKEIFPANGKTCGARRKFRATIDSNHILLIAPNLLEQTLLAE